MKLTKKLAQDVELLLRQAGYTVRMEKGNFKGGFCVLEQQKLVMINAYYPFESRLQSMIDILIQRIPVDELTLDDEQLALYRRLQSAFVPA
jgi:hypothetical protein